MSAVVPPTTPASEPPRSMPPVLNRLLRGSFFLALKTPMAVALAFISIPLTQRYIGVPMNSAYQWAWGFGFFQSLLEFGMSSALQRNVTDSWTRGDRDAVNRSIACGMSFYACMSLLQIAALLGVAYYILPTMNKFSGEPYDLILKLLWLQIITAPFFGLSAVLSSVLQAARRYEFVPRLELVVVFLRFCILAGGLAAKINFFWVVLAQTAIQILLLVGPALWVMIRELGYRPHFRGANWSDTKALLHISGYMFLLQLSVVLADKIDTVILGFALSKSEVEYAITVYQNVSKPFLQIRQTGWTLAYLVMPAVASLAAAHDDEGLERIKYDGTRYLVGILLPISLLAAIYAAPFLKLWVGERFEPFAPLAQLFLVATLPLVLSVLVQMAIGLGKIKVIAISAFVGSLFNLPISYWLTYRYGVSGVIWGTVLTTLFSNLLVPGIHVFKVLEIDLREFALRTLSPPLVGASALVICCLGFQGIYPANPRTHVGLSRYLPFLINLTVGCLAYLLGYVVTNSGRSDLSLLVRKLRRRTAA